MVTDADDDSDEPSFVCDYKDARFKNHLESMVYI